MNQIIQKNKSLHYLHSSFREKIIEHIFVGDCLRELWVRGEHTAEMLTADVDAAGYDIVIDAKSIIRHIQLKASFNGASTKDQKVNSRLTSKPSGCVIWVGFDEKSLKLGPYRWFGGNPGEEMPSISTFSKAKQTKANAQGEKSERRNTYIIPKSKFTEIETMPELVDMLFGQN